MTTLGQSKEDGGKTGALWGQGPWMKGRAHTGCCAHLAWSWPKLGGRWGDPRVSLENLDVQTAQVTEVGT